MAKNKPKPPARPPGTGRKSLHTPPDVVEQVFAFYCAKQNYRATSRKFGLPLSTVFGMINDRAGGPQELERIRTALRADMIEEAFSKARELLPAVSAKTLGSAATSVTADASRAFEALVRAGNLMTPEVVENQVATTIHVHTSMPVPPEIAGKEGVTTVEVGPGTTTTADKETR